MNQRAGIGSSDGNISAKSGFDVKVFTTGWTDGYKGLSSGLSDGLDEDNREGLAAESSAPDEPTVRQLKRRMICANNQMRWMATASSTG
jgi:hypothetical protein